MPDLLQHKFLSALARVDLERVREFVLEGADVNQPIGNQGGETPLIRAITTAQLELVKLLIEAGADVNLPWKGPTGWTPLMFAHDSPAILAELLAAGADVGARAASHPLKAADNAPFSRCGGETALHLAAAANNAECVKLLAQAGADVEAKAENGCGPMDYAVACGSPTAAAVALAEAGAQASRLLSYQIPSITAALAEAGALFRPDLLKEMCADLHDLDGQDLPSSTTAAPGQCQTAPEAARDHVRPNAAPVGEPANDERRSELRCPYCHSLLYSRVPKLCGRCGKLLPPEMVASEPAGPALDDQRKWARDLADKFDPLISEKGAKTSVFAPASEVPEWVLQQVSWAEEFKNRKRPAFKFYVLGYSLVFLAPAFVILRLELFPSSAVACLTLALMAISCYRAWNRASPICPNCKRNITLCHADYCHVCGEILRNRRCQLCAVDNSWTGHLRPFGSAGNSRWIVHCPGCGVFLDTRVSRWRIRSKGI
ncbi:MAG: ankyrin repeat domain-containing protein [Verrucomicrobiota bacterium]|jgi:ankyrin repeat protein